VKERWALLVVLVAFAACGGSTSDPGTPNEDLQIYLNPTASGWAGGVRDSLGRVSHAGGGYTGEIDVYRVLTPEPGRLQISLSWDHGADFDLIVAADPYGTNVLDRADISGHEPEYLGLDVAGGQLVYILIAGWEGDPGDYTLETILLPYGAPVFDLEVLPDFTQPWPRNRPIRFSFNVELEPQDIVSQSAFIGVGSTAEGRWCIEGADVVFYPDLPVAPGDPGGLRAYECYTLQFPRAARGLRAVTGEYLSDLITITFTTGWYDDDDPTNPPHVTDVDRDPALPWDGGPVHLTMLGQLDPETLEVHLLHVQPDGTEVLLPVEFQLTQSAGCLGALLSRLEVEAVEPLPAGALVRVRLPGTIRGITGDPSPSNLLEGRAGFEVDFRAR
jgi:hypothetical protein